MHACLSCKLSEGSHHRHAALNGTMDMDGSCLCKMHWHIPYGYGKRPDGILEKWQIIATSSDTFAPRAPPGRQGLWQHQQRTEKKSKSTHLNPAHTFTPVVIETTGVLGHNPSLVPRASLETRLRQSMVFLNELGPCHNPSHQRSESHQLYNEGTFLSAGNHWTVGHL